MLGSILITYTIACVINSKIIQFYLIKISYKFIIYCSGVIRGGGGWVSYAPYTFFFLLANHIYVLSIY